MLLCCITAINHPVALRQSFFLVAQYFSKHQSQHGMAVETAVSSSWTTSSPVLKARPSKAIKENLTIDDLLLLFFFNYNHLDGSGEVSASTFHHLAVAALAAAPRPGVQIHHAVAMFPLISLLLASASIMG
jgi:hypothetical protein